MPLELDQDLDPGLIPRGHYIDLLKKVKVPLVIDADGLNILSANKEWLHLLPAGTILTPHPKEFERLAGESGTGYDRNQMQMEFAQKLQCDRCFEGSIYLHRFTGWFLLFQFNW